MNRVDRLRLLGIAGMSVLTVVAVAACGGGGASNSGGGGGAVKGNIAAEGSSTVEPITVAASELFGQENPDVKFEIGGAGTSDGFESFCKGDTQISDASRPIDVAEEVPICEENGVEFIELPVAYDGISVVVNSENDFATDITSEELKTLWEPPAEKKITTWNQVRSDWPDEQIKLYGPGTESGTFEFFADEIVGLEEPATRTDYQASEDDNVLVQGVGGDPNALGYFGFAYYENNTDKLKALALDGVEPNPDTISSGEYPLSRPLFIYVNSKELEKNKALQEFVKFYLSEANINKIVEAAKYVPLPKSTEQEARTQFEDKTTGTVFDEEGKPKGGDLDAALKQAS